MLRIAMEASALLPPRTGVARYVALLARQFARDESVTLDLLINAWRPKHRSAAAALRREFSGPRTRLHLRRLPGRFTRPLDKRRGGWALTPPPAVVHGPNFLLPALAGAPPGVITIHDLYFLENMESAVTHNYRSELPDSVARARAIVVISEVTASVFRRFFPGSADKLVIIPVGVADSFRQPPPDDTRLPALPAKFYLSVGATGARKNLPWLAPILAASPEPIPWVIAGPPDEDEIPLRAACAAHGVALIRLPAVDDAQLNALYRRALALLAPSHQEGYFFPAYEASVCGLPVVANDLELFREPARRHGWTLATDAERWRLALAVPESLPRPAADGIATESGVAETHLALYRRLAASATAKIPR